MKIYRYDCELHTAAPEKIVLSDEMYMEEDGWYGPGNSDNDYLHFHLESDGSRTYLFTAGIGNPGDTMFYKNLEDALCDKSGGGIPTVVLGERYGRPSGPIL